MKVNEILNEAGFQDAVKAGNRRKQLRQQRKAKSFTQPVEPAAVVRSGRKNTSGIPTIQPAPQPAPSPASHQPPKQATQPQPQATQPQPQAVQPAPEVSQPQLQNQQMQPVTAGGKLAPGINPNSPAAKGQAAQQQESLGGVPWGTMVNEWSLKDLATKVMPNHMASRAGKQASKELSTEAKARAQKIFQMWSQAAMGIPELSSPALTADQYKTYVDQFLKNVLRAPNFTVRGVPIADAAGIPTVASLMNYFVQATYQQKANIAPPQGQPQQQPSNRTGLTDPRVTRIGNGSPITFRFGKHDYVLDETDPAHLVWRYFGKDKPAHPDVQALLTQQLQYI